MLVFDVPERPGFARDTETGEIFGMRSTKEIDTIRAFQIGDGVECSVGLRVSGEPIPRSRSTPAALRSTNPVFRLGTQQAFAV
jgi:hypothetical protein